MKNTLIILIAILAVTIAGCESAQNVLVKNTDIVTTPAVAETTAPAVKENHEFKIGDEAPLGDFIVKVNKAEPFESTDEFVHLENDQQLIAVEVEYTNRSTGKKVNSNPLDWSAIDNEGYTYNYTLAMAKEPLLNRKILNDGGKVKGWVTFQLPKANKLVSLQFKPNLLEDEYVEFVLQNLLVKN